MKTLITVTHGTYHMSIIYVERKNYWGENSVCEKNSHHFNISSIKTRTDGKGDNCCVILR